MVSGGGGGGVAARHLNCKHPPHVPTPLDRYTTENYRPTAPDSGTKRTGAISRSIQHGRWRGIGCSTLY